MLIIKAPLPILSRLKLTLFVAQSFFPFFGPQVPVFPGRSWPLLPFLFFCFYFFFPPPGPACPLTPFAKPSLRPPPAKTFRRPYLARLSAPGLPAMSMRCKELRARPLPCGPRFFQPRFVRNRLAACVSQALGLLSKPLPKPSSRPAAFRASA